MDGWINERTRRRRSSVPLLRRWRALVVVLRLGRAALIRRVVRLLRLVVPGHRERDDEGWRIEKEAVRVSEGEGSHRLSVSMMPRRVDLRKNYGMRFMKELRGETYSGIGIKYRREGEA
jgi:hypothetical protein